MTEAIKQAATTSWRTTVNALLACLVVLYSSVVAPLLDDVDSTEPDWSVALAAVLGFVALWNARDHKVSSEQAGAKIQPKEVLP